MSFNVPIDPVEPGQWVVPPPDLPPDPGVYSQPQYGQPPYDQPQYGQPPYSQPQYGQPTYPSPYPISYPAPGYSPYPVPGGLPGQWPGGPPRPGQVMAASVLGYVTAGLLILAGLLLLIGATIVNDLSNSLDGDDHGLTAEFVFDGFGNLVAAGLLIAGGSMLTTGNWRGRLLISVGAAIVSAFAVYWIIRTQWNGVIVWGVIFTAMPIIAVGLAFGRPVTDWLARQPQR
ncbi:MAG: hypothetical protein JWM76_39 [Pseudonocardiales bacterium]|nr:hypothetical protein [Pseudonocardiales bacterium]